MNSYAPFASVIVLCPVGFPFSSNKFTVTPSMPGSPASWMPSPSKSSHTKSPMLAHALVSALTIASSVSLHPLASVTVTVYVVVELGLTVILSVDSPLLHKYSYGPSPPLAEAVKITSSPGQITLSSPAFAVGLGFTVTITESTPGQPSWLYAVT